MDYIGEHLLPGRLGHLFILLSLISSVAATVCYFLSVQKAKQNGNAGWQNSLPGSPGSQWRKLGRVFFIIEAISVAAVFAILFYIISNHYFEYKYVWQHSSRDLEPKYLLSCFWEGQEGSFLLWSVWHCVLGLVFIWKQKKWEAPVMAVVSFVQVLLATMLLGDVFGMHIGSNPFVLMRNTDMLDNAPVFFDIETGALRADYVSLLYRGDGNGLNILLQNYWMVIHPPVLFLGFASTLIPFAFAVSGLWMKKYTEWTKAALPWALFSAAFLGLGIMMGAAWAYESLNFGGYWAWDPVENAVLVPWLVLMAGIHTLVIFRHTGNALRTTNLFFILTFLFILYSTYLTRSGDLQDTSVHAFTGDGITVWHLRILLLIFAIPSLILFFKRYKQIPHIVKEEETSSREFWMFVGSLVLFLSSILIILMTSIPVINKLADFTRITSLFNKDELFRPYAMGEEAEHAYNRIQIFVAIILGLFSGFGMYLKYKSTPRAYLKKLILPLVIAVIAASLVLAIGDINYTKQGIGFQATIWVAVAATVFAAITNGAYIFTGVRGRVKNAGGAISHLGFALMLLGILISSSKKEVISLNRGGIPAYFGEGSKENPGENLTLVKGLRTDMGKYWVTYNRDSVDPRKSTKWFYILDFESKDGKEKFTLKPNAFVNEKGQRGLSANPDARHYLDHDIFLYITSLPDPDQKQDTASFRPVNMKVGDTVFYSKGLAILDSISVRNDVPSVDSVYIASLTVKAQTTSIYNINTYLIHDKGVNYVQPDTLQPESLVMQLQNVTADGIELGVKESDSIMEYVTMKAYRFPWINILWAGTIIMFIGMLISMYKRMERKKLTNREIRRKVSQAAVEV